MRRLALPLVWVHLASLAAAPALADQSAGAAWTLLTRDGRRPLAVAGIGSQEYVAVDDLAAPFGTAAREAGGGLTITAAGRTIIVTADQAVVSSAGRLVSMPAPALRRDGRWYVPIEFLARALGPAVDQRIEVRRGSRLVVVGDLRVPRVTARVDAATTGTSITFDATPATTARVNVEGSRLVVQFDADAIDGLLPLLPAQPFVAGMAAGEAGNTVVLTTGPRFGVYRSASSQPDAATSRLTLEFLGASTDLAGAAAAVSPPADPRVSIPLPQASGLRTVVIDPGHGGDEMGAQGPGGTREKDVTLAVARRLRTLIESRLGLRVFLTRDDDRTLSHDDRSAFANNHRADVFLSIHANAAVRAHVRGAEVYYLSVERADAEARRLAGDSGAALPVLGGGARAIDLILWETAQARYLEQSADLAGLIEGALRARVEMSPRAVQQAPFRVLVGANMPAVLVEIGYLSNPAQERELAGADYQTRVAEALLEALVQFRTRLERAGP